MTFDDALLRCLSKYAVFTGRAAPAEFWWFALVYATGFVLMLALLAVAVGLAVPAVVLQALLTPPALAVTVRRLHDIGTSGSVLLFMVPGVGQILLLAWLARAGVARSNRFGREPEEERESCLLVAR